MPWTSEDVERHKKGLTDKQKGQWVAIANSTRKRCIADGDSEEACDARAIKSANAMVTKEVDMSDLDLNLSEAVMKKEGAESFPASAYLVVEDPEQPSKWHLRVRDAAGKADHRHMGAAFAALTGGYRGQKYAGPNKAEALRKLKALYKAEDMPVPGAAEAATEALAYIAELLEDVKGLLQEAGITSEAQEEESHPELETTKLAETYAGAELLTEGLAEADGQGPLTMKIQPIRPGFGNAKDGNYYPAAMLKRDARVMVGAKMYETDHREKDKSTRTWVSTVTDVLGFSDAGAPVCEVVVHDPNFAQRVRNLAEKNLLDKMECSILGDGRLKRNQMVEGRKANIVEALTKISSVDWVTKAGAGGKALAIAESERDMDNKDQKVTEEVAPIEETPQVVALVLGAVPVLKALLTSGLPQAAQERLAEGGYADEDALKAAIDAEKAYLDAARPTGGGRPFGMSGTSPKLKEDEKPLAERESAIVKKYRGG